MGFWDTIGDQTGRQFVDDRAKTLVDRGIQCHNEEQYQDAIENYKAAIAIDHNYVDPHHFLANTYGQLGQFEDAFKEYRIAFGLAQKFLPKTIRKRSIEHIMNNLSLTITARLSCQSFYRHAVQDFKKICGILKSPPPFYHAILGRMYQDNLGLGKEAIREFKKFLSKDKDGEVTDLIRAKIEEIQLQGARRTGNAHSTSKDKRKKKWWQLWKSESPNVQSQNNPTDNTISKESKPKSFEGKTKKCINCNETLPENGLVCPFCGSGRFIWD